MLVKSRNNTQKRLGWLLVFGADIDYSWWWDVLWQEWQKLACHCKWNGHVICSFICNCFDMECKTWLDFSELNTECSYLVCCQVKTILNLFVQAGGSTATAVSFTIFIFFRVGNLYDKVILPIGLFFNIIKLNWFKLAFRIYYICIEFRYWRHVSMNSLIG